VTNAETSIAKALQQWTKDKVAEEIRAAEALAASLATATTKHIYSVVDYFLKKNMDLKGKGRPQGELLVEMKEALNKCSHLERARIEETIGGEKRG